jgi:hypothetical protein
MRGRVPRSQIKRIENSRVLRISITTLISGCSNPMKKINAERRDIKIILVYSAMKIKAKVPPAYSVLNPDTNSLSPSAKSNGVRFVSASLVVNQM